MSAFENVSTGYPSFYFKNIGDAVAGRIVGIENYQCKDYKTKEPKTFDDGNPIMGVRITLEQAPGDESTRVVIWCEGKEMMQTVARAFRAAGRSDVTIGDDLAISHPGYNGRAKKYEAGYAVAEDEGQQEAA